MLVNNAGYGQLGALEDVPVEMARRQMEVKGYSDSLRMEVKPFGVDVVVIEPGGTDSEWIPTAEAELERYSSKGAYAGMATAMVESPTWHRAMPPAGVVTDVIMKAVKARRPKARCQATRGAGTIVFLRRVASDRLYDRLIMRQC